VISSENTPCSTPAASVQSHIDKSSIKIPVAVLLGPTAVGKSALAIKLAQDLNLEVISCDSRQIYRGMDIGTAKVSLAEQATVRHWFIDVVNPDEAFSAFRFAQEAAALIRERTARGKRMLLCGGSGLYFKVLAEGGIECGDSDPHIRKELTEFAESNGSGALHALLAQADPASAARIHCNDTQRLIRALAVFRQTGKTLSTYREQTPVSSEFAFSVMKLVMPRELLYDRINRRVEKMVGDGLYQEFLKLRGLGFNESSPGMQTVGYRELFAVEREELSFSEAVTQIQQSSRHYAKRQLTWFSTQVQGVTVSYDEAYQEVCSRVATNLMSNGEG